MSSSSSSGTFADVVRRRGAKRTNPTDGKDVREVSQTRSGTIFRNNWADSSDTDDNEEKFLNSNNSSSSNSSSSSGQNIQPFIANMQFQTTLTSRSQPTPQQQFAARNASLLNKGYTLSPITGQVYRLTESKPRSQEFIDLQKTYDSKRAELVAYNRTKGYTFDPVSKTTHNSEGIEVNETSDPEFSRLRKQCEFAKASLKSYKQRNPVQFAPMERKRRRNVVALQRAAQRRLERLASRQVLTPAVSIAANTATAPIGVSSAASPAVSLGSPALTSNPVHPPIVVDNSAVLAQLAASLNTLVGKFNALETGLNEKIARIVQDVNLADQAEPTESMDSNSLNE